MQYLYKKFGVNPKTAKPGDLLKKASGMAKVAKLAKGKLKKKKESAYEKADKKLDRYLGIKEDSEKDKEMDEEMEELKGEKDKKKKKSLSMGGKLAFKKKA